MNQGWPQGPQPRFAPSDEWIPAGQTVQIGGKEIAGGMIYVGPPRIERNDGGGYQQVNPEVIDQLFPGAPLPADPRNSGPRGYAQLVPPEKAAYIGWLNSDRDDQHIPDDHLRLYYAGLERRVVVDSKVDQQAAAELPEIQAELERLLETYGHRKSQLTDKIAELLSFLDVVFALVQPVSGDEPPHVDGEWDLRARTKLNIGLGELIRDGQPVPGPWAYAFLLLLGARREDIARCPKQFERLFLTRYAEVFGDGLTVPPVTGGLVARYQPLIGHHSERFDAELPTSLPSGLDWLPQQQIRMLADECAEALTGYSEFVERVPSASDSAAAISLLPAQLITEELDGLRPYREYLEQRLLPGHPASIVDIRELHSLAALEDPALDLPGLLRILERLGVGMEPDARLGGPALMEGSALLFRLGPDGDTPLTREYAAATVLVHLAAVVSMADKDVSVEEQALLIRHLETSLQLNMAQRTRLIAHLHWLLISKADLTGLKRRLSGLTIGQRQGVAEFCTLVAAADGTIHPEEISTLKQIYSLLELDPEAVNRHVGALTMVGAQGSLGG
ncbi:hypothetical protein D5S17_25980 [Pseudonocardiaceae bacterium YIM PH 21723]|nr:hypothetical protein D5S17_25980 [Pseudonocardiaceae bacterium YIM PH 21723]